MNARGSWIARIDRALYPAFHERWDDKLFRETLHGFVEPGSRVLDLGAGTGRILEMNFRGIAAFVAGVDPDPRVRDNPHLDEAHVGTGDRLPFGDGAFDLVFCDNVAEHLERPEAVFREVARVLRPGGHFLIKTPNRWHYMPAIATLTPLWFHRWFNRLRGRPNADTFRTYYRANSARAIRGLAAASGLEIARIDQIEGRPEYLRIAAVPYLLGAAYERLVNSTELLRDLRILLVAVLRKPE